MIILNYLPQDSRMISSLNGLHLEEFSCKTRPTHYWGLSSRDVVHLEEENW